MTAGYRVLSYAFRVRTRVRDISGPVDELLGRFRASGLNGVPTYRIDRSPSDRTLLEVFLDGECVQRSEGAAALVEFLVWHVSARAIERIDSHLALHAAALAHRGRGVVLPAPPDSGKTTLSAALTRAGFEYLSDEAALIDPGDGLVHPFPRPLWMERPTLEKFPDLLERRPGRARLHYQVLPEELRPGAVGGPCRVRFVVAPAYRPGSTTRLEPMSRAEAIVLLGENSFNLERFGAGGVRLLGELVAGADCYRLPMGDLPSAVAAVRGLVEAEGGDAGDGTDPTHVQPGGHGRRS